MCASAVRFGVAVPGKLAVRLCVCVCDVGCRCRQIWERYPRDGGVCRTDRRAGDHPSCFEGGSPLNG